MATNLDEALLQAKRRKASLLAEQLGVSPASPVEPKPETADVDFPPLYGQIIPGLSETEKAKFTAAFVTNQDEMGLAESLQSIRPDTKVTADSQKNIIVKFGPSVPELSGKSFLVNPPGFDKTDVAKFFGDMFSFGPAGRIGAAGKSLVGRVGKTVVGEGATSIGLDFASQGLGSKQPVNYTSAAVAALTGGAVEWSARPLIAALKGIIRKPIFFKDGQLTERGNEAVRASGLNPDEIGPALAENFAVLNARGIDPFTAGSEALGREFDTKLTRGQSTGNVRQSETEEALRQGVGGDDAQQIMLTQQKRQGEQLTAARDQLRPNIIDTPVQAGGIISEGVQRAAVRMDNEISAAYREAGDAGAAFNGKNIRGMLFGIREGIQKSGLLDKKLTPGAMSAMKEIRGLSKKVRGAARARDKGQIRSVDLAQFELTRRRLNRIIDTIPLDNKTDRNTTMIIKGQMDKYLDDAFDSAMFNGDPDALTLIKKARALRTEFGKRFEPRQGDKEAGRIVQTMLRDNPTTEQATNMLIGYGQIGGSSKLIAPKVVDRLNKILGNTSDEMMALKEAVLLRVIPDVRGQVSPAKAQASLDKALKSAPTLMNKLFAPEELNRMKNFQSLLQRLELPAAAQNPSGSGFRLASLLGRVLGAKFGMSVGGTLIASSTGSKIGKTITSRVFGEGRAARNALKPPQLPGTPAATAAAVGATRNLDEELPDF